MTAIRKLANKIVMDTENIEFRKSGVNILTSITVDPSVTATQGSPGDLIITTAGQHFVKQDNGITTNWINTTQVVSPGFENPAVEDLDMNSNSILNLATPVALTDAANKNYVDRNGGFSAVATSNGTDTLNSTSNRNRAYIGASNHTVVLPSTATLTAGDQFIISNRTSAQSITIQNSNLGAVLTLPFGATAFITVITTASETFASLSVPTFSVGGSVNLNNQKVVNLATPTANADAATKLYVDTRSEKETQTYLTGTTDYTLANTPATNSVDLHYQTGLAAPILLIEGVDYTVSGAIVSIITVLTNNDKLHFKYTKV